MKKCILTSFVALMVCDAYGAFDFANYTPMLTKLYTTNPYTYIPSAYIMNVTTTNPNDPEWIMVPYATYTDGNLNNVTYYYHTDFNEVGNYSAFVTSPIVNTESGVVLPGHHFINNEVVAISNTGSITSIIGDFWGNTNSDINSVGGAIYNETNESSIGSITGDFINNSSIGIVSGDAILGGRGGAIMNFGEMVNITGNFIDNTASFAGGAIINVSDGTITNITGDFINNSTIGGIFGGLAFGTGGAIYNGGAITNITGNFVNNTAVSYGSAIYNSGDGSIENIIGDFINNNGGRGTIANKGSIGTVTANFVNNSSEAIYNQGTINSVSADFIHNTGANGAVYNDLTSSINSITGNFIDNTSVAINNLGNIGTIEGDFINNVGESAGAVYTNSGIVRFTSSAGNHIISDNYQYQNNVRNDIAIKIGFSGSVSFNNINNTHYTINDEISGSHYNGNIITIGGDNTGYTAFNNNIDNAGIVNITNGKMVFGRTPNDYTGAADVGRFSRTNPVMNLNNGTFDIANGYTETITLNGLNSTGNNNFLSIDLDTVNQLADFINVETSITGQINLIINALSDLDIDNHVIWFAEGVSDSDTTFTLSSVSGLDYDLDLYVDTENHKYGLVKEGVTNPTDPNNQEDPNNVEPGGVLSGEIVQMANYTVNTIRQTVQKMTNSMQKRIGEIQWLSSSQQEQRPSKYYKQSYKNRNHKTDASELYNAFWTRGVYKDFDTKNTSVEMSGIEFGYDRIIFADNDYKWYLGGLGYASGGTSKFNMVTTDLTGYGLGAYTMLITKSGWFADLVFRQHFINIDTSDIKTDYTASSLNMEIGKEFVFGANDDTFKWFMKPSIEGTYIAISGTDVQEYKVKDSDTKMASFSLLAGPRWDFADGDKFQMYAKASYTLDKSDDVDVVVNNITAKQSVATDTIEVGAGLDYRGINNTLNLYFETSYITGTDYSEVSGNLGLRYAF